MDAVDSLAAQAGVSRAAMEAALREEDGGADSATAPSGVATPRELGNIYKDYGRGLMKMLPSAVGQGAAMLVPPLRLARFAGPATAALRTGASAAAGAATAPLAGLDPAKVAMEQGGATLAGEGILGGLRGMARGLMGSALRPSGALQDAFDGVDLVGSALKERVPVGSQAMKEGSKKLGVRVLQSSSRLNKRLADADVGGFKNTVADLSKAALRQLEDELGHVPTTAQKKNLYAAIRDEANALLADRRYGIAPKPLTTFTARQTKQIKQAAQRKSRSLIRGEQSGNIPAPGSVQLARDLSKGALQSMPPGAQDIERETQRLMGTKLALRGAEKRNPPPPQMRTWRGSLLGPLETPQFQSRAALALDSPVARMLALGPRGLALLLDQMAETDDTRTP